MKAFRLLAAGVALAILTACGGGSTSSTSTSDTLTIASLIDLNSFAPADGIDGHYPQYLQPVYDSLIRIDPKGELQPMLATEWSYDETRTVLTLKLREGITFSDGAKFDADAAKANLLNVKDGGGTLSTALLGVTSIDVLSPQSIQLTLAAPDPTLLRNLGQPPGMMASPASLGTPELKLTPVGSGPYTLDTDATTKGSVYTYVRSDNYWDESLAPYDRIVIKPIPDTTARLNALRSGQADVAMGEPKIAEEATKAGLDITSWQTGDLGGLFLWDRDGKIVPALKDVRVRQAINYAIDADALVEKVYRGYGTPTRQVFNPNTSAFDDKADAAYSFDPAKAKSLLADAGYPDGFDFPLPSTPLTAELEAIVGQQLKDVGITVKWQKIAMASALAELSSGKYPGVLFFFQSGDPWQAINYYIAPQAPWNPLHTEDATVNDLIAQAQQQTGDEQGATYRELNRYLVDQAWFAPYILPKQVFLSRTSVKVEPQAFAPIPSIYNYSPAGS